MLKTDTKFRTFKNLSPVLLTLIAFCWMLIKFGMDLVPGGALYRVDRADAWPLYQLSPQEEYLRVTALNQIIWKISGLTSNNSWYALHFATFIVSLALVWKCIQANDLKIKMFWFRIILFLPINAVLLEWIGMYDPFTLLLLYTFVLLHIKYKTRSQFSAIVVAFLLGLQHFEQALLAIILISMVTWKTGNQKNQISYLVKSILSIFAGKLFLSLYLFSRGVNSLGRINLIGTSSIKFELDFFIIPLIIWSSLGLGWIFIIQYFKNIPKNQIILLILLTLIVSIFALIVDDKTRVLSIVLTPSLLIIISKLSINTEYYLRIRNLEFLFWLMPPLIFWQSYFLKFEPNVNLIRLLFN